MLQTLKNFEDKRSAFVEDASLSVRMIAVMLMIFGSLVLFISASVGGTAVITYFEGTLHDPNVLPMFGWIFLGGLGVIVLGYVIIGVEHLVRARSACLCRPSA